MGTYTHKSLRNASSVHCHPVPDPVVPLQASLKPLTFSSSSNRFIDRFGFILRVYRLIGQTANDLLRFSSTRGLCSNEARSLSLRIVDRSEPAVNPGGDRDLLRPDTYAVLDGASKAGTSPTITPAFHRNLPSLLGCLSTTHPLTHM